MALLCAEQHVGNLNKTALSGILGLLGAEQNIGNLNKCTFRKSGTPVRGTKRRKYQKVHLQEFWDTCAQHKTSEISQVLLSEIRGFLCAEQNVEHLKKCTFRNYGILVRRTKRRKYQKCTFIEYGILVHRTNRRKSKRNTLPDIMVFLCAEQHVEI